MIKMRNTFLGVAVFMFSLMACKKNSDITSNQSNNSNNNTNNSANADSTMLLTYFEIDTTITSGQDTLNKSEYSYDNNKRVVALRTYYYSSLPAGRIKCTNHFFYNGNDTLPTIRVDDYPGAGIPHPHRDSVFLFYDVMGRLILDSVIQYFPSNPTQPLVISYRYEYYFNTASGMDAIDITRTYYYAGPQISEDHTDYELGAYGNLEVTFVENSQFASSNPHLYGFNYDSHPNPFYVKGCRDYSPFHEYSGMPFIYDYHGMSSSLRSSSKYNITSVVDLYFDGAVNRRTEYSFDYKYRSDGYPSSLTIYVNNTGAPIYKNKGFYVYGN